MKRRPSLCLTRPSTSAIANVKAELRPLAHGARCHEEHGHTGRHEATLQVPHGGRVVAVQLRWPR